MKFKTDLPPNDEKKEVVLSKKVGNISSVKLEEKSNLIIDLENKTSERIRLWAHDFYEDIYDNKANLGNLARSADSIIKNAILEFIKNIDENEKLKNFRLKSGISIFIETLINFVEEKSININEKDRLNSFINDVQETMFSFTPNIFSSINLEDMVILSAKANRVPEAQGWFGQTMVGEIVYELNWPPENVEEKIVSKINKLNTAEILDILEQLETIGAHASGEMYDASNAFEKVVNIINSIRINKNSPIINCVSDLIIERLGKEADNPSLGFVTYHGNKEHSRLSKKRSEGMNKESDKISHQINPDIHIDGLILPIASDAIASFDHSNTPRYFSIVDYKSFAPPQELSIILIKRVLYLFEQNFNSIDENKAVGYINKMILEPLGKKEITNFTEYGVENIINELINIKNDLEKETTSAHFEKYNSILDNKTLNPFINNKEDNQFGLLLQHLHKPELRNKIEHELQINLNEIPLRSQIHFLKFLSIADKSKFDRLKKILEKKESKDNIVFLKSFLSMSGDESMGDKILTLGEKLREDVARKLFEKYGEIIDVADKAEEEVKKLYEKDNIPESVFVSIKETLLKKGASLLSSLADELSNDKKIDEVEILKNLEDIKTSTIIMGKSYLELYKQGIKVPVEEIKDVYVEKISATNLTDEEKNELLNVYEKGRPKETYENKEHLKLLTEEFGQTLNNKETFVFNIRFGGEIVAFATFYKENDDTLHIGGLTFIDDVRNPAIGEAVMKSIMNEFGGYNIKALVHSENKVLRMYQNRFGFKIVKELPREENAGELYFEIERPKDKIIEEHQDLKKVS